MRFRKSHRSRHSVAFLFLALSILGLVIVPNQIVPLVHASPFVNEVHITDCASPCGASGAIPVTAGNTLVADCFVLIAAVGCSVADSLGNSWTLRADANSAGNIRQSIFTATVAAGGSDTFTFTSANNIEAQVVQYTGITGIGTNGIDNSANQPSSFTSTVTITTSAPSVVFEGWDVHNGGGTNTCATLSPVTGATIFSSNCDISTTNGKTSISAQSFLTGGPGTFPFSMSWTGATNANNAQVHIALELDLPAAIVPTTSNQCYGNCGSPAITLANTNSTHGFNFNQSLTFLYEFQSNLNGFLLNVTVNLAKAYGNINGPGFGVYTIASCPVGQAPFSPQCPGLLQQSTPPQIFTTLPKGRDSFSGLRVPVSNGEWVGIGLTGVFSGLDVNDTNTNVQLFQTSEGKNPPTIQAAVSFSAASKVGLWAWINGNVVATGPQTSPSSGACGPGLDSILGCAVNSLCTLVTSQCQTGSSMFLIIILTILTLATVLGIFSYWLPSLNLTTRGMGEFAVLIFVGWFITFASFGLLLPWLIIFAFFIVAWLFMGRLKGTGPI